MRHPEVVPAVGGIYLHDVATNFARLWGAGLCSELVERSWRRFGGDLVLLLGLYTRHQGRVSLMRATAEGSDHSECLHVGLVEDVEGHANGAAIWAQALDKTAHQSPKPGVLDLEVQNRLQ